MPPKKGYRHRIRRGRRIKGRGLFDWIGKAGSWISKNVLPIAKKAGSTAFKLYNDPNVRALADQYASPTVKKYMGKADEAIKIGKILTGAMGNGRRRRTIRLKKRSRTGRGLGMYGRGLGF